MPSDTAAPAEIGLPIATQRLLLRQPEEDDIAGLAALFSEIRVTRWLALETMDLAEATAFAGEFVANCKRGMADSGCAPLVVSSHSCNGGAIAGYCGLQTLPERDDSLELVYAVLPGARRKGIVTEAARACIAWGFSHFIIGHVAALTRAGNSASLAVMANLGMAYAGLTDRYYGERLIQFELSRAEFESRKAK